MDSHQKAATLPDTIHDHLSLWPMQSLP